MYRPWVGAGDIWVKRFLTCLCLFCLLPIGWAGEMTQHHIDELQIFRIGLPDGRQWVLGKDGIGRPFSVRLLLLNRSDETMMIWDPNNTEGASAAGIILTDGKNRQTVLRPVGIERSAGVPTVITIAPDGVFSLDLDLLRLTGQNSLPAGNYSIKGEYRNNVKGEGPFENVWTGRIVSESSEITITSPECD